VAYWSVSLLVTKYYSGKQSPKNEMVGGMLHVWGKGGVNTGVWCWNLNRPLGRTTNRRKILKLIFKKKKDLGVDWIDLAQDSDKFVMKNCSLDLACYTKPQVLKAVSNKISPSSMCHMNSITDRYRYLEGNFLLRLQGRYHVPSKTWYLICPPTTRHIPED
jgi:hypothetical protein